MLPAAGAPTRRKNCSNNRTRHGVTLHERGGLALACFSGFGGDDDGSNVPCDEGCGCGDRRSGRLSHGVVGRIDAALADAVAAWADWRLYFTDERCLPTGDPDRNDT
ncbi:MAG: 6-phosphogluconolactonase, partial [Gammaproteobacteria bacterium]|nr:6-phosphogluconolactonase [Gammaproteobacteria bacterium]